MANERATAIPFVDEVIAICSSHRMASVTFFAILDTVSVDGTRESLENHAQHQTNLAVIWAPENRCVVDAYVHGYREALAANCDWILEIDAGYSHDPKQIPQFLCTMQQGYDCVFGSRFVEGGDMSRNPLKRRILSRMGSLLSKTLLNSALQDMTSGFQLFSREAIQSILARGIKSRSPFFQTEMKFHCRGLRVIEVPITYSGANHSIGKQAIFDSLSNLWRLYTLKRQEQI